MAKRQIGIIAWLLCFCLCLTISAQAATTADATTPIDPAQTCALTLVYSVDNAARGEVLVNLYKIADVSADYQYTLTPNFAPTGVVLNGVQTQGEWNVIRATLQAHVTANASAAEHTAVTDTAGKVCFAGMPTGLYLAVAEHATCTFDAALVALPALGADGRWQYTVTAAPKGAERPPISPDEEVEYKVLKTWKGDTAATRPSSVEVEIFRNGTLHQTVILSQENGWVYRWTAKDDGAVWSVIERNVPQGYTMTVAEREQTFLLTNTATPDEPHDPPHTGDTFSMWPYILLMILSGSLLMVLGVIGMRKRV